MVHPCDKPCGNKTASGYCATTACINPQYSNIGTAHYGQGVQERIVTNADKIRAMGDVELARFLYIKTCEDGYPQFDTILGWLDWLKQEVEDGDH